MPVYPYFATTLYVPRFRLIFRVSFLPFVLYFFNAFQEPLWRGFRNWNPQ